MTKISCLVCSHNKPDFIHEAINSVVDQDFTDWEIILMDSGVLYDEGFFEVAPWCQDGRIQVYRSGETEETRRTKAMAAWCFNECFRRGLVNGEWVVHLCDDDYYENYAFSTIISYANAHPECYALYTSQNVGAVWKDGRRAIIGERRARGMVGRCCGGGRFDCVIDYAQLAYKRCLLERFDSTEYWPEAPQTGHHADGLFGEKIGSLVPIHPVDIKTCCNRRTWASFYGPAL